MSFYIYETTVEKQTTAQRLINHLDENAKEYYEPIVEKKGDVGMTETNAERLERLKNVNDMRHIVSLRHPSDSGGNSNTVDLERDIDWLIEQAERAQELECALESVRDQLFSIRGANKRHDTDITGLCIEIGEALEGVSNGN